MVVIIPAAGMGTRMGLNLPKSLIPVRGRLLIEWQLHALDAWRYTLPVRLVVGHHGDELARVARRMRPDIEIVYNNDYAETNTMDSVSLAAALGETVLVIDGDVLFTPADIFQFMLVHECGVGVKRPDLHADAPVYANCALGHVHGFSRNYSNSCAEWACMAMLPSYVLLDTGCEYIYQACEKLLPAAAITVDTAEVDTPEDLERAKTWIDEKFGSSGARGRNIRTTCGQGLTN